MNSINHSFQESLLPSADPAKRLGEPRGGAMGGRPGDDTTVIETDIAPRLDRLPWDRFHTLVVVALGITWILDGLEVTLAGSPARRVGQGPLLHLPHVERGL